MRKSMIRKIISAATAAVFAGSLAVFASAATTAVTDVTLMDSSYYQKLGLTGTPSLTITKYKNDDAAVPIQGVEFKVAKVGDLYQVADGTDISMAYGITSDFTNAFEITADADYSATVGGKMTYFYKDINWLNSQRLQQKSMQKAGDALRNYVNTFVSVSTDPSGKVSAPVSDYGLYAVVEWSTQNAKIDGKPASLTNTQSPFLIALPTYDADSSSWNKDVVAKVKNSTAEPISEKKIVTGNESASDGSEAVDDTDITSIGDVVKFRLKGTIPAIPQITNGNQEKIGKYEFTDNLSKGLTPDADGTALKGVSVRTTNTNYALTADDYTTSIGSYTGTDPEYAQGSTIKITLTPSGLDKLSKWAADTTETKDREIYFYYTATVNANAVTGPNGENTPALSGNPNEMKLGYKIGSSADMETSWSKVTEYTFGIRILKQLSGDEAKVTDGNKNNITFALYSQNGSQKKYYAVEKESKDGEYHVNSKTDSSASDMTKMSPAKGGALTVKGLEEGTYYLEELSTVSGYHLLKKPAEIKITANRGDNTYTGTKDQYTGTINDGTDSYFGLTVNNTKGFELPSTGGAGILLFVLAGAIVLAAGCGYYVASSRKNRGK